MSAAEGQVVMSAAEGQVVLVRHADYVPGVGGDAALSPAGRARAEVLVHVLGRAGVGHVIVSQFLRTQQTAAPLVARLGIDSQIVQAQDQAAVVAAIAARPSDETVLVVGHSDTVPALVRELSGVTVAPIALGEFDNLICVQGDRVLRLRYGAAS